MQKSKKGRKKMIKSAKKLLIEGSYLFNLLIHNDNRGRFVETWNEKDYEKYLPEGIKFIQDDYSSSWQRVLRGLHGDDKTWKLIQCIYGSINFVMLDIDTKKAIEIILSDTTPEQILVPPNCAIGHLCLSTKCVFYYKQTTIYGEATQFTVKWNDPIVTSQVKWKEHLLMPQWNEYMQPILSDRDKNGPFLEIR